MNTTASTRTDDLDRFETALLTELRTVVADRPTARRRKRRLTLAGVAASATAAVVGVSLAVGGSSPAFAVHQQADGDVVVTINRLSDASGLKAALAEQGMTADVDFAHPIRLKTADGETVDVIPNGGPLDVIPEGAFRARPSDPKSKRVVVVQRGDKGGGGVDCDFGEGGNLSLTAVKGGYVLTIPHASALTQTHLHITTAETSQHHASLVVSTQQDRCIQIASSSDAGR